MTFPEGPATFVAGYTSAAVADQGRAARHQQRSLGDENVRSLQHTVLYGLKGVAAYAHHAHELGYRDEAIDDYHVEALADLARYDEGDLNDWLGKALRCGEMNYKTMELLDKANTETFGTPVPTEVPLGVKEGKAILVSGHDLLRPPRAAQADRGQGHHHLHPRRDAPDPRLSRAQEVPAPLRQLGRPPGTPSARSSRSSRARS